MLVANGDSSETSIDFQRTILRYILQGVTLHNDGCGNVIPCNVVPCFQIFIRYGSHCSNICRAYKFQVACCGGLLNTRMKGEGSVDQCETLGRKLVLNGTRVKTQLDVTSMVLAGSLGESTSHCNITDVRQ
jgi:hypothetical protein